MNVFDIFIIEYIWNIRLKRRNIIIILLKVKEKENEKSNFFFT